MQYQRIFDKIEVKCINNESSYDPVLLSLLRLFNYNHSNYQGWVKFFSFVFFSDFCAHDVRGIIPHIELNIFSQLYIIGYYHVFFFMSSSSFLCGKRTPSLSSNVFKSNEWTKFTISICEPCKKLLNDPTKLLFLYLKVSMIDNISLKSSY